MAKASIIVVDADISWTLLVSEMLVKEDYEVFTANRAADALVLLDARHADAAIVELNLPDTDPIAFYEQLTQRHPVMAVIVCTARPNIEQAFELGRRGALGYLPKSITPDCLAALRQAAAQVGLRPALEQRATASRTPPGRGLLAPSLPGFYGIISQDPQMEDIFELIRTIADSTANVLICGETGTGKELVARAIHEASNRHGKPFVAMDCSALARELLESELFGHEKGAFTGAHERCIGRFERANGGTLFLDEVGNIDPAIQAKLLRVIQTRTFERVGGQQSISVDVRIVAATNTPLEKLVAEGKFREDLYHRLNVVEISLLPLRERGEDVVLLAREFMRRFAQQNRKDVRDFTEAALQLIRRYRWPGNVRELENVILQAVVLSKSPLIDVHDLPRRIAQAVETLPDSVRLADQLEEPERQIIINAIRQHRGNIKRAAEMLDISRTTLYAKLKKYPIDPVAIR